MPWVIDSKLKVETTLLQKVVVNGKELYKVDCVDKNGVKHTVFHRYWVEPTGGSSDSETMDAVGNGSIAIGIINHAFTDELKNAWGVLEFDTGFHSDLAQTYNFRREVPDEGRDEEVDIAQMVLDFFCCITKKDYANFDILQSALTDIHNDGSFSQLIEQYGLATKITEWINTWIQEQTDAGTYTEAAYQSFISTVDGSGTNLKEKMNGDESFQQARQDFLTLMANQLGITKDELLGGNW